MVGLFHVDTVAEPSRLELICIESAKRFKRIVSITFSVINSKLLMIYEIIQVFNGAMFDDKNAIAVNASPLNTHIQKSGEWKVRF